MKPGMSVIVKTVASWVKILVILFGVYIILFGHLTPGGGFAGGVIIAGSYILLMLAYGKDFVQENFTEKLASRLDSAGAIMFIVIALLGFLYGGGMFFNNFIYQNPVETPGGRDKDIYLAVPIKIGKLDIPPNCRNGNI